MLANLVERTDADAFTCKFHVFMCRDGTLSDFTPARVGSQSEARQTAGNRVLSPGGPFKLHQSPCTKRQYETDGESDLRETHCPCRTAVSTVVGIATPALLEVSSFTCEQDSKVST